MPAGQPAHSALFRQPTAAAIALSQQDKFRCFVNDSLRLNLRDYRELHAWSILETNAFWCAVWDFAGIIGERGSRLFDDSFPIDVPNPQLVSARLNYAENLLLSHAHARSSHTALVSVIEPDPALAPASPQALASTFLRSLSFEELYQEVRKVAHALKGMGVVAGDRVVAFSPSNAEAVVACLAAASLGAVWSSCPPEFGVNAVLERFTQIEPKVILTGDTYRYAGKLIPIFPKLVTLLASLPSIKHVLVVGHLSRNREPTTPFPRDPLRTWTSWGNVLHQGESAPAVIPFLRASAMAPLYVLYSSGTTGKPKAIVHCAGGVLLSQKMSNELHSNCDLDTVFFQFSTLGWMMWNLSISVLASGSTVVMYDGSPLTPLPILWSLVDAHRVTTLGISPRYLQVLLSEGYRPNEHHSLKTLGCISTTGSPLKEELYDWIKDHVGDQTINNGSGGTDICGAFVGSSATMPIYYGELQAPLLGMQLEAWNDEGKPVKDEQGNMVITRPFPNMPIGFWGDEGGKRYHAAYFEEFEVPVWTQGDWIEISSRSGGVTIFGRSDGVLNPGGVRFGSAELYDVVEEMKDIVEDCIAVGQKLVGGFDERVILFVKPKTVLDDAAVKRIKAGISSALSPRHVPAVILDCPKIPYTTNGKRLEVACKKLVNGIPLANINISAAEDPKALDFFINNPKLVLPKEVIRSKL